jgi:NAD+ synthase (glutamine-hydrolysing)
MKIALAQINTTVGDFDGNVAAVRRLLKQAAAAKADLVVCPELTVTGYSPRDLVEIPHFIE